MPCCKLTYRVFLLSGTVLLVAALWIIASRNSQNLPSLSKDSSINPLIAYADQDGRDTLRESTALRKPPPNSTTPKPLMNSMNWRDFHLVEFQALNASKSTTPELKKSPLEFVLWNPPEAPSSDEVLDSQSMFVNSHVVFVGDSSLRYQYLNLAYQLLHQKGPSFEFFQGCHKTSSSELKDGCPAEQILTSRESNFNSSGGSRGSGATRFDAAGGDGGAGVFFGAGDEGVAGSGNETNFTKKQQYEWWSKWYAASSQILNSARSTEVCDCFQEVCCNSAIENRFFSMNERKYHLSFFSWFKDDISFRGHWTPSLGYPVRVTCQPGRCKAPWIWEVPQILKKSLTTDAVVLLMTDLAARLKPMPKYMVLNRGFWGPLSGERLEKLFEAGQKLRVQFGTCFIWKTTSLQRHRLARNIEFWDNQTAMEITGAVRHGWPVVDIYSETKKLMRSAYWDNLHFRENITSYFNNMLVVAMKACDLST
eukprot:TRINITY_DN17143_c0_g2_i3.p1 TRINITY_DN17143_c0_g2~~TRINITY_DN17143_c0_g2_i3.p1  ORF type:complete len:480 (-),score=55.84 TRINITY_DN17143_c0_g2_i3:375-1814(-)